MRKAKPRPKKDWRKLPRKPAATRRTEAVYARVTAAEAARVRECADAAGVCVSDYIRSLLPIDGPLAGSGAATAPAGPSPAPALRSPGR